MISKIRCYAEYFQVQIKESPFHPSQISDLVGSGTSRNSQNTNKIKKKERNRKKSHPNSRNVNNKMKIDNVRSGVTNNKNTAVEGLTHHVLSSSTKISSSSIAFFFFPVIQILLPITTLPHFYLEKVSKFTNLMFVLKMFCLLFLIITISNSCTQSTSLLDMI